MSPGRLVGLDKSSCGRDWNSQTSLTTTDLLRLPLLHVIVMGKIPPGVVSPVVTVSRRNSHRAGIEARKGRRLASRWQ